jgi:hypothetical protein
MGLGLAPKPNVQSRGAGLTRDDGFRGLFIVFEIVR